MKYGTQASVYVVLQGKGGVGKSFVSAILAQYFRTKSAPVHRLDTDPVNATFAQYRMLEAEHLKVLRRGTVNEKQFDVLVEKVCRGDGMYIVDSGATTFAALSNGQSTENDYDNQNIQSGKDAFLAATRNRQADDYLRSAREDFPGDLKALVTSKVYDKSTGPYVLTPQDARLIRKYDSRIGYGLDSVQVAWSRIIYHDTPSLDLDGMLGFDSYGNARLRDKVDRHYRLIGSSVLKSMFTAAFEILQRSSQSALVYRSLGQTAANAVGQELSQTGGQITRRNLSVHPTIKVPPGYEFTVRVNHDILFKAPYEPVQATWQAGETLTASKTKN